jgi:hypothetical protein
LPHRLTPCFVLPRYIVRWGGWLTPGKGAIDHFVHAVGTAPT